MSNPLVTAIPAVGQGSFAALRQNLALSMALPLKDAAAVAAFHTWDLAADATPYPAVIYAGTVFEYDASDGMTAHDPEAGCITDVSGRRYKRADAIKPDHIVLDKDLTAPPASPGQGDAYFVATAATGAWAGHDDEVAVYGRQGWHFRPVDEGEQLYVSDEASYYHMPSSGTLTKGFGDLAIGDNTITTAKLKTKFGYLIEARQDDPPVSMPGAGVAYIVGDDPSGAWVGHAEEIAESNGVGWEFFAAPAGSTVYNKATDLVLVFKGGAWVGAADVIVRAITVNITDHDYAFSIANNTDQAIRTFNIEAKTGDSIIMRFFEFKLEIRHNGSSDKTYSSGGAYLKRDNLVSNALDLPSEDIPAGVGNNAVIGNNGPVTGFFVAPDDNPHDYKIGLKVDFNDSPTMSTQKLTAKGIIYVIRDTIEGA